MNNSVVIKGNKNGMILVLDKNIEFEELKRCLIEKFTSASKFFEKANMAIAFEGRDLSAVQEKELLDVIAENTELNIVCVIDNDEVRQLQFKSAVDSVIPTATATPAASVTTANAVSNTVSNAASKAPSNVAQVAYEQIQPKTSQDIIVQNDLFYKGTLRSGQVLESEGSIVILGDVNPGGKIVANGNIVILGCLKGNAFAGAIGDVDAFVVALEMDPMQIQIGEVIARCSDGAGTKTKVKVQEPKIAYVEAGNIYIEKFDKEVLSDIRL